jgi:secreted protein with Ig-like and vWFA domain
MSTLSDSNEPASIDDLQDRLVDRGLTEIVGHETPPDLSDRILFSNVAATPRKLEAAVATGRRRIVWIAMTVAATLLVAISVAFYMTSSQSESAASRKGRLGNELVRLPNSVLADRVVRVVPAAPPQSVELSKSQEAQDFDSLTDLITSTVQADSFSSDAKKFEPNLSLSVSQSQTVEYEAAPVTQYHFATPTPAEAVPYYAGQAPAVAPAAPTPADQISQLAQIKDVAEIRDTELAYGDVSSRWDKDGDSTWRLKMKERIAGAAAGEGTGPGLSGDQYTRIVENPFVVAEGGAAVSTFSIDVDTASYANVRQFLMQMNTLPPPDAVRIEELINYFDYDYAPPADAAAKPPAEPGAESNPAVAAQDTNTPSTPDSAGGSSDNNAPFAAHVEVAGCPWAADHRLVRIGIKGRELDRDKRPKSNFVFLVDVSGSMDEPDKLPLVVYGLQQLTRELGENDRVAIVVYASSEGLVLPSTSGDKQNVILDSLGKLSAGGSTAGGAGIQLAYQIAEDNFIEGGTNRVVLCTDGDFNVGVTSTAELERLCEQKAKDTRVFLSVLGFGRGNLNDAMMQAIAGHGNGNHYYVDNRTEARRVLVEEMTGTLVTIAKDVKIQVEFNPQKVAGYRLIGYENRMLRTEDFNDDKKDAGEIGAGHTVTALYEVVPAGMNVDVAPVDDLKYQKPSAEASANENKNELLTLKMRYKEPEGDTSAKLEWPVTDDGKAFSAASADCQFAAAVAGFGMLLRDSQYKGNLTHAAVIEMAQSAIGKDEHGYRTEFLDLVRKAKQLRGK